MKVPCKGCKERHEACHDKCERFKEYKDSIEAAKKRVEEGKRAEKIYRLYKESVFK